MDFNKSSGSLKSARRKWLTRSCALLLGWSLILNSGCATSKTIRSPVLSDVNGKKVALLSIEGESTASHIVEVSLVNQLLERGSFILASKNEIELIRSSPEQDPLDWKGIAKKAGADYALEAKILKFEAFTKEGYSTQDIIDSQLAEEQGTEGKTTQVFKVKALEGKVEVQLVFRPVSPGEPISGIAQAQEKVEANASTTGIHLPPRLRFLEKLTNRAFQKFFEKL